MFREVFDLQIAMTERNRGRVGTKRAALSVECLEDRVNPAGTFVASSFFDSAIYAFDATTGALQKTLVAPNSSTLLSGPAGLAVGPDQNLYISSQFNNAILQYNLATDTLKTFIPSTTLQSIAAASGNTQFAPAGLQFGPDNNLYVTLNGGQSSSSGGGVVRFDIHLGVLGYEPTGSASTVATGLIQPSSLTFGRNAGDTNNLYVSNSAVKSVVKVTGVNAAAPVSTTFITAGAGNVDFPSGLTWGDDGKLYVVDLGATSNVGKVVKFNADGTFNALVTPTSGPGNLQFQFPSSIAFDGLGHFITANLGPAFPPNLQGTINQYNLNGTFAGTLVSSTQFPNTGQGTSGISPSQLVMLPTAQPLLFSSYFDSAIYQVDSASGAVLKTLVAPYNSAVLSGPAGLAIGPDRNLYISSQNNNAILKYNLATDSLTTFIPSSVLLPIAAANGVSQFAPSGLQFGPDGNLYVGLFGGQTATSGGAVVRFDIGIGATNELAFTGSSKTIATGLVQPSGVAFGSLPGDTNNLYVTNSAAKSIVKVTGAATATPTSAVFVTPAAGSLDYPAGLTWGSDGKLYVTDLGATSFQGKLVKFNADGSLAGVVSPGNGQVGTLTLQFPSSVLFNNRGSILTANLGPNPPQNLAGSVYQYRLDGSFDKALVSSSQFPNTGPNRSGASPSQLAITPVLLKNGTVLTGTPTPNPSAGGQAVTWTVTVAPSDPTAVGTPSGSVSFSVDGGNLTTVNLTGNQATFTSSTLTTGPHTLTAIYNGDTFFANNTLSVQQTVAIAATTTTLTANPAATTGGTLVTFTATVAPSPGPGGTVTFKDNGVVLPGGANIPVVNGVATYATSTLSAATHPITAEYSGAGNFAASKSNTLNYVVNKGAPQVVSVTLNGNIPSLVGSQRSRIASIIVTFDQTVKVDPGAMTLSLHTNGVSYGGVVQPAGYGSLPTSLSSGSADLITFVVTFVGNTDNGPDGFNSIKDGLYDFKIDATKVHAFSNQTIAMTNSSTTTFHRLFGDTGTPNTPAGGTAGVDFEAVVNSVDNLQFRSAFNNPAGYRPYLDFDGDGSVVSGDNLPFRLRFNKSLKWKA